MGKIMSVALALTVGVLIAVSSALAASSSTSPTYTVHMTGAQEKPKGSPKGKGTFKYQLVTSSGKLCYSLKWSGIATPYASHIHKGVRGVEGPVVIPLSASSPVAKSGCVKAKKSLLLAIKKKPSDYYVNVHNKQYPGGAIRGQL
ncbi:MAG TPA: CHRD domain-containing protein [Solirubrobacteraceae bacterium]|jgi:hypothetical protein|nr:CHRD domain-containing protein [Solirubrobacteraceae bacterium]